MVSVVLPCLNEADAVGACIVEAQTQIRNAGISGEVIVCDNGSHDGSASMAAELGARVVDEARRGYGLALSAGIHASRGRYVVMADADGSYDLSALPQLVAALEGGADIVIGNRYNGRIQPGAMPWLHQYVGGPLLSALLNLFFGTRVGDVNCGLRAFAREAYDTIAPRTIGMEFASEMMARAAQSGLTIAEVPVNYRVRIGTSKLRRYRDGWRHLRFLLMYSPTWLYLVPSLIMATVGLALLCWLAISPLEFLGRRWDMHLAATASLLTVLASQVAWLGISARTVGTLHGFEPPDGIISALYRRFSLESGLLVAGLVTLVGVAIAGWVVLGWVSRGLPALDEIRPLLLAITLIILGVQAAFNAFFLSLLGLEVSGR